MPNEIIIEIKAKDNASAVLKGAGQSSEALNRSFGGLKSQALALGTAFVGAQVGIAAVGAGLRSTFGAAVEFDRSMQNVQSIARLSAGEFESLKGSVLDMAKSGDSAGQSINVMARGLYDLYSSGFQGRAAMDTLKVAAQGAAAGLTTTDISTRALAGVLNAFGQDTYTAKDAMDIMFKTVDQGVITFEELASTMGMAIPTAAALDVPLEEVGAAIAVMTRNGLNASMTMTSLNGILSAILKPSEEAADLAADLGLEWNAAAVKSKGLVTVLQEMITATGGSEEQMAVLLGDVRAMRGAFVLAKDGGVAFNDMLGVMKTATDGAGATAGALVKQSESLSYQWAILKTRAQALAVEGLTPVIRALADLSTLLNNDVIPAVGKFVGLVGKLGIVSADNIPGISQLKGVIDLKDVLSGDISKLDDFALRLLNLKGASNIATGAVEGLGGGLKKVFGLGGGSAHAEVMRATAEEITAIASLETEFATLQVSFVETEAVAIPKLKSMGEAFGEWRASVEESMKGSAEAIQGLLPTIDEEFAAWSERLERQARAYLDFQANLQSVMDALVANHIEAPERIILALEAAGPEVTAAMAKHLAEQPVEAVAGVLANLGIVTNTNVGLMTQAILEKGPGFRAAVDLNLVDPVQRIAYEARLAAEETIRQLNRMMAAIPEARQAAAQLATGIPAYQHGGIVTRPTIALVGEAGPEAIVPLGRQSSLAATSNQVGVGGLTINFNAPIYGLLDFREQVTRIVRDAIQGGSFRGVISVPGE